MELKKECFVIGHAKFFMTRISESAISVGIGKKEILYACFIRDFRSQLTKVSKWDNLKKQMIQVETDEPICQYELTNRKVESIIRKMITANG